MNNFKKYSIAALSISLLVSAPAHAGFADLYKQAGQYAQNIWAHRPSMPTISLPSVSMPKISMPEVKMPAISLPAISMPQISMPSVSRAQVEAGIEAVANYAQKAEAVLAQYPKTVAATKMAAKVVPVVLAGGYLAKKAINKYNAIKAESTFEDIRNEMIAKLDKDLIGGSIVTAVKVMNDAQEYISKSVEQKADKVPGTLHFERDLSRYLNIFPDYLGNTQLEWNTFVKLAIAHDNAKDNRFAEDLLASFDRLIIQLQDLNALINGHDFVQEEVSAEQAEAKQNNEQLVKRVIGG